MPIEADAHDLFDELGTQLAELVDKGNPYAGIVYKILSDKGQAFLEALKIILKKPSNQEVVNVALDAVSLYLSAMRPQGNPDQAIEELRAEAEQFIAQQEQVQELLELNDKMPEILKSLRTLSGMGYGVLRPALHGTTAIGSLMRRKLEPVFKQLHEDIEVLSK